MDMKETTHRSAVSWYSVETAHKGSVTGGEVHFGGWMVEKGPGTDLASKVPSRDLSPHSDLSSSRKLQLYQWTKLQFVS